jgi:hypothetical protein
MTTPKPIDAAALLATLQALRQEAPAASAPADSNVGRELFGAGYRADSDRVGEILAGVSTDGVGGQEGRGPHSPAEVGPNDPNAVRDITKQIFGAQVDSDAPWDEIDAILRTAGLDRDSTTDQP